MSKSTISTFQLFNLFPDEPAARKYLEGRLWKNGVDSPKVQGQGTNHGSQGRLLPLQCLRIDLHCADRNDI